MQVSSGQDGIQRLLAAEAEAQAVISKARAGEERGREERGESQAAEEGDGAPSDLPAFPHPHTTAKADRLRAAKAEAERELKAFRTTREEAYEAAKAAAVAAAAEATKQLDAEAGAAVAAVRQTVAKGKNAVVADLVRHATSVKW